MRLAFVLLLLALLGSSAATAARDAASSSGKKSARPPNIIIILADDLGYGDITASVLVNRTHEIPTPNIQTLANSGMRFTRGYSGQVCAPSRCTLMTGRHEGHCTIRGNDGAYTPLLSSDTTVAKVLKDKANYTTGLVGKWGLGDFNTTGYPLVQGFDYFLGQSSQVACHNWYPSTIQLNEEKKYKLRENKHASATQCGKGYASCLWANDLYAQESVKFIADHAGDEAPFFLFFSTTTPHTGHLSGANESYPTPWPYSQAFPNITTDENTRLFATAVKAQDDFVGAIVKELEQQGILEETFIFFSGDNGPDDHNLTIFDDPGPFRGKKRSVHEGGIRQTIIASWPSHIPANTTTDHLFSFWDFLPTAADLAGVPRGELPKGVDGLSAASVLLNDSTQVPEQHKYLYWEYCNYADVGGLFPDQYEGGWAQAVRFDEVDNLTSIRTEWKGIRSNRGPLLLFNLTADITESINVTSLFPSVAGRAVSYMEEAHVEDPFWKSSNNASDRCCASCFDPNGCSYPCKKINPAPSCVSTPDVSFPPTAADGLWRATGTQVYSIAYNATTQQADIVAVDCPLCCWQTATAIFSNDGWTISAATTSGSCQRQELGNICVNGKDTIITWQHRWSTWEKVDQFSFDFD